MNNPIGPIWLVRTPDMQRVPGTGATQGLVHHFLLMELSWISTFTTFDTTMNVNSRSIQETLLITLKAYRTTAKDNEEIREKHDIMEKCLVDIYQSQWFQGVRTLEEAMARVSTWSPRP
ncbi:hypothetical protein BDA99DRAFT_558356 [Phascolomyces articulosus]|uniref:Uncharacterized protein n=1 Tax=Phascolomyces articulosus TaxID=60185 RepID=A0AAD5K3W8_9FUNG|nr:hypothetical protein BDA99DRAFT_558356 [Phascolomyces articulosus]